MDSVTHFEIPADDVERARAFYRKLFGWKIQSIPDMDYTLVMTSECDEKGMPKEPGAINGGIFKRSEAAKDVVIVIKVQDIDASLKQIEQAGSKIVMPKVTVGDFGLYARVEDTERNTIGIWQDVKKS